jgi:hypothetical protein
MGNWETFDNDRFVGRDDLILEIEDHVCQNRKRVISVVGGPGTGKSWLLAKCKKKWGEQNGRFIFTLHCPDVLMLNDGRAIAQDEKVKGWLRNVLDQVQMANANFPILNLGNNTQFIIQEFVRILCEDYIQDGECNPPVLLVDDYDELDRNAMMWLNKLVLEFFLSNQLFAIVLARRDQNGLSSDALRRNEVVVEVQKYDQVSSNRVDALRVYQAIQQKFYPNLGDKMPAFKACMECLKEYDWAHPFINTFLSDRFLSRACQDVSRVCWTDADIKDCIEQLVSRPRPVFSSGSPPPSLPEMLSPNRYPPLTSEQFSMLWKIANDLPPTWVEHDLFACVGKRLRDLRGLFELGIIISSPNYRFQVMDGLRSLFRTYKRERPC